MSDSNDSNDDQCLQIMNTKQEENGGKPQRAAAMAENNFGPPNMDRESSKFNLSQRDMGAGQYMPPMLPMANEESLKLSPSESERRDQA